VAGGYPEAHLCCRRAPAATAPWFAEWRLVGQLIMPCLWS
jgi:hypothetical protein